jgi:hypothetical protein
VALRWAPALLLAVVITACGDDEDGPPDEPPVSMIRGQVEQGGGFIGAPGGLDPAGLPAPAHLVGAVVTVARIDDDGHFVDVTRDTAVSDQNGRYVVSCFADDEANLVVSAVRDAEAYRSLVTLRVQADSTVTAVPMTNESTAEAEIWARIQEGPEAAVVSRTDLAIDVNAAVGVVVVSSPALPADAAAAVIGQAQAERAFHLHYTVGTSPIMLAAARTARHAGLVRLEQELDAVSEDGPATFRAYEAFFVREREAWITNGVAPQVLAVAREAGMREYVRRAAGVRSDLKRVLSEAAALQRARTTAAAVDTLAILAGLSPAGRAAIAAAGLNLRYEMYGIGSDNAIRNAFRVYANAVVPVLSNAWTGAGDEILGSWNALREPAGPNEGLNIAVAAAASADDVATAHAVYRLAAEARVINILADGAVPVAARVPAARILMLLAMAY